MDVNLPSQQPDSAEAKIKNVEHTSRSSMQLVFGGSIIILAIVIMGVVCFLGNVQVPYFSALFAPTPIPLTVMPYDNQQKTLRSGAIATSSPASSATTATTSLKK